MRPTEASIPCLCGLAVECIHVVERAELSTVLARLVTAGCELLATLLLSQWLAPALLKPSTALGAGEKGSTVQCL